MVTLSCSSSSPSLNYYNHQTFLRLPRVPSNSYNLLKGTKKNGNSVIFCCNNNVPDTITDNISCLDSLKILSHPCRILQKYTIFGGSDTHVRLYFGESEQHSVQVKGECVTKRRELLLQAGSVAFSLSAFTSIALAENDVAVEDFRVYSDEVNKFKITIPSDWQVGAGEGDGVRSLIAFYPREASNSNVSIVITSLGADFTKLESFGKVDAFAENLVSGFDRSWQRPPGVKAKLIDCKASKGLYYIEYTLQNPGESLRHLFSVLGIADNGVYNRLYTLTGQFVDEEAEKYGAKVQKAVSSFRLI